MESREYLKPAEAAELLRVSPATLMNWRRRGTGPRFVRIGDASHVRATILYPVDALREFLSERMRISTLEPAPQAQPATEPAKVEG